MIKQYMSLSGYCNLPFTRMKFSAEGGVTMCCFQERKCLGNILEESLEDIWKKSLSQDIRQCVMNKVLHTVCQIESCPYNHCGGTNAISLFKYDENFPSQFELDLPNTHCNYGGSNPTSKNPACLMCERNRPFTKQQDKVKEICNKIKKYIPIIKSIHIQGVAEPFWQNKIFEVINWLDIKKVKHKIEVSAVTNGSLMDEKRRSKFLELPKSTLIWSLDAGSPAVYEKIRRHNNYDKIIKNLMAYGQEKSGYQKLRIHNNINLLNIMDVENMVEVASQAGVDEINFNATYNLPAICVNKENSGLFKEAQRKIIAKAQKLHVNATFLRNLYLDY